MNISWSFISLICICPPILSKIKEMLKDQASPDPGWLDGLPPFNNDPPTPLDGPRLEIESYTFWS